MVSFLCFCAGAPARPRGGIAGTGEQSRWLVLLRAAGCRRPWQSAPTAARPGTPTFANKVKRSKEPSGLVPTFSRLLWRTATLTLERFPRPPPPSLSAGSLRSSRRNGKGERDYNAEIRRLKAADRANFIEGKGGKATVGILSLAVLYLSAANRRPESILTRLSCAVEERALTWPNLTSRPPSPFPLAYSLRRLPASNAFSKLSEKFLHTPVLRVRGLRAICDT